MQDFAAHPPGHYGENGQETLDTQQPQKPKLETGQSVVSPPFLCRPQVLSLASRKRDGYGSTSPSAGVRSGHK